MGLYNIWLYTRKGMEIFIIAFWKLVFFIWTNCFLFFGSSFWDKRGLCGGRRIMCTGGHHTTCTTFAIQWVRRPLHNSCYIRKEEIFRRIVEAQTMIGRWDNAYQR